MLSLLSLLAAQAPDAEVIVSAKRLEDASVACARNSCTPLRDAQISIAWAEHQFREGAYLKAKRTLAAALSRNRRFATSDPRPLAALYEAYGTVTLQEGDLDAYSMSVRGRLRTLRDNLPSNDPAVAAAELATGDMWVKLRNMQSADVAYQAAEQAARSRGQTTAALVAVLRRVWLAAAVGSMERANRLLAAVASEGATDPTIQMLLPIVRLQVAAKRTDDNEVDAILEKLSQSTTVRPTLLWAPAYDPFAKSNDARYSLVERDPGRALGSSSLRWADIGFWIKPDGRTGEIEVLRGSPSRHWTGPIMAQIGGRRYTATADSAAPGGIYRIERFTVRGTYDVWGGYLSRRRGGDPYLEILDLTAKGAVVVAKR